MRKGLFGVLIAFVLLFSQALPVYAAPIASPDTLEIYSVDVYSPYIEASDQLWIISYTIDYTTNPTDGTATDLFQINILDAGGAIVSSLQPYSFWNQGFNKGFLGFYYSGASHPTWTGVYSIELIGNAAYVWTVGTPPPSDTFLSININWHAVYASAALTQAALVTKFRSLMPNLTYEWGPTPVAPILMVNSAKGLVLTTNGEDYLTNTVYEARTYLNALFQLTENPASAVEATYDKTSPNAFLNTSMGTVIDLRNLSTALSGGSVTDQNTFGMFFLAMICIGLMVIMMMMGSQFMPAFMVICLVWCGGGYVRMIHLTYAIAFPIILCTAFLAWKYAFQAHY